MLAQRDQWINSVGQILRFGKALILHPTVCLYYTSLARECNAPSESHKQCLLHFQVSPFPSTANHANHILKVSPLEGSPARPVERQSHTSAQHPLAPQSSSPARRSHNAMRVWIFRMISVGSSKISCSSTSPEKPSET